MLNVSEEITGNSDGDLGLPLGYELVEIDPNDGRDEEGRLICFRDGGICHPNARPPRYCDGCGG